MSRSLKTAGLLSALAIALPLTISAHRAWMLPSATVLSGTDKWVTIDAAISNDLFYFEHFPMRLEGLAITAPDGTPAKAENQSTGRYRSTFDVQLTQSGTYKIAVVGNNALARFEQNGEQKMLRGAADKIASEVPKDAKNLTVTKMQTRMEVFVTSNKPTTTVLKPTGQGLELSPITHPNDLVVGEPASFVLLHNGKPAADLAVAVIPGGIRYRDNLNEIKLTTDKDGKITVTFKEPGMYWLNATVNEAPTAIRSAAPPAAASSPFVLGFQGPSGRGERKGGEGKGGPGRMPAGNRASYTATLEVLPQ